MQPAPPMPRRTKWAIFAAVLAVFSVGVELVLHLCSQTFFDPLPDWGATAAYLLLPASILFSEFVLGSLFQKQEFGQRDRKGRFLKQDTLRWRVLGALALSGVSLGIALVFTAEFLPLLPIAAFPLSWMGFGFCALSPAICLAVVISQLRALLRRSRELDLRPYAKMQLVAVGAAILAVPLLVARPLAIGYFFERAAVPEHREAAVRALRLLRAEREVLNQCYRGAAPAWIWLGRTVAGTGDTDHIGEARKIYYLVTGRPFESADASHIRPGFAGMSRRDSLEWEQQGGELVGHTLPGLSLASSRVDGVLDPGRETAYAEWTMVFRNTADLPQEARWDVLLPEGGVVDKVSLWIKDEERPAAFGPRSVVREAYQQVAVVQQRDPLLVTAKEPGHVMAQCFPVPANGEMKVRLGMSAPLVWTGADSPALSWSPPSLQQVNFRVDRKLQHEIWMEGSWEQGQLTGNSWSITGSNGAGKPVRTARARFTGDQLSHPAALVIAGLPRPEAGQEPAPGLVRRRSPLLAGARPVDLLVVVDPTAEVGDAARSKGALDEFLSRVDDYLPRGSRIHCVDTRTLGATDLETEWKDAEDGAWRSRWLRGVRFEGGVEPGAALARAWDEAAKRPNPSAVLWIHGPTPKLLVDAEPLRQRFERRPDGPPLIGACIRPGPDALLDTLAGKRRIFALGDRGQFSAPYEGAALAAAVLQEVNESSGLPLGGREPAINGLYVDPAAVAAIPAEGLTTPAQRLAITTDVLHRWYNGGQKGKRLKEAQKLAISRRLVTPITGAVVLETKAQYDQHGLNADDNESSIPSVPEPATLAMLLAAGGAAGAAARRRRRVRA